MIGIINYGMGNVGSILNMLKRLGAPACLITARSEFERATKLILPGVGSFDAGMNNLGRLGLREALDENVLGAKIPILGICLGMQLLSEGSEEGVETGLGWVPGATVRFRPKDGQERLKVPHMGWNIANPSPQATLFKECGPEPRYYFVHSYYVVCRDPADVAATVTHGYSVAAAVQRGNIYGVQFHPEKSHRFGMKVLENFARL